MSGRGDYGNEMRPVHVPLDDAGAEALLAGAPAAVDDQLAGVSAFIGDLRECASLPAPPPSPALAALLRDGSDLRSPATVAGAGAHPVVRPLSGWRRRLAVTGLGLGVALTGVVGAGAAGLLPDAAERVVADLVETLTPLHLPDRSEADKNLADRPGDPASPPAGDSTVAGSPPAGVGGGPGTGPGATIGTVRQPGDVAGAGPGPGGGAPVGPGAAGGSGPGLSPPELTPPPGPGVGPPPNVPTTLPVSPPTTPDVTAPPLTPPGAPVTPPTSVLPG